MTYTDSISALGLAENIDMANPVILWNSELALGWPRRFLRPLLARIAMKVCVELCHP